MSHQRTTAPPSETLNAIANAVWDATRELGFIPECCIAATSAAARLVRKAGWTSRPQPVRVMAANRLALDIRDADLDPADWPEGAYSVGADERADPELLAARMNPAVAARTMRAGRFPAHLVLIVNTLDGPWLLDASVPQFARPAYGIEPFPFAVPASGWAEHGLARVAAGDGAWEVHYQRIEDLPYDFKAAPDWSGERTKRVVAAARRHLQA